MPRINPSNLSWGLEGVKPKPVFELENDFMSKIVGAHLVRARSQTTYYILSPMKVIYKAWLDREWAEDKGD